MEFTGYEGHLPQFPPYVNKTGEFRNDVLAVTDGQGGIITEWGEVFKYHNFDELREIMFTDTLLEEDTTKQGKALLLIYDGDLATIDIFDEFISNSGFQLRPGEDTPTGGACRILITKQNTVDSIKFYVKDQKRVGPRVASLVMAEKWSLGSRNAYQQEPSYIFENMRSLFQYVGYGTSASPTSLGLTILRQSFWEQFGRKWLQNRHRGLPNAVDSVIRRRAVTSLVSTPGKGKSIEQGEEIDIKGAYPDAARSLPAGSVYRFFYRPHLKTYIKKTISEMESRGYKYWYAEHICTIHKSLAMGLFPVKMDENRKARRLNTGTRPSAYYMPVLPGRYEHVWMDYDMAKECEEKGVEVEVCAGYGWMEMTHDLNYFVDKMALLRDEAPTEYIRGRMKEIANQTLGGLGMSDKIRYFAKPLDELFTSSEV
jgi:hypothetical protein